VVHHHVMVHRGDNEWTYDEGDLVLVVVYSSRGNLCEKARRR